MTSTSDQIKQALLEQIQSGKMQPTHIVLGDYVQHKIDTVQAGGIGVQENHYHGAEHTADSHPAETSAPAPTIEDYLTFEYKEKRKSEYEGALSVIRDGKWNDKDHARIAKAIYDSKDMIRIKRPATFMAWYRIYCEIFGVQYHEEYTPSHLKTNKATQAIEVYL